MFESMLITSEIIFATHQCMLHVDRGIKSTAHTSSAFDVLIEARYLQQEASAVVFGVIYLHDIAYFGVGMVFWIQHQIFG